MDFSLSLLFSRVHDQSYVHVGRGCEPKHFKWSYNKFSNYYVGTTVSLICLDGFTRMQPNMDRMTCMNREGILQWIPQIEDCEINYCPYDLNVPYAELVEIYHGHPPKTLPPGMNETSVFYETALLRYKSIAGYVHNGAVSFTRTCQFPPNAIGRGVWQPTNIIGARMLLRCFGLRLI